MITLSSHSNRNRRSHGLLLLVLLIACLILPHSCVENNEMSFDAVTEAFHADFDTIDAAVKSGQHTDAAALPWIDSVSPSENYVEFYCGGSGIGSQTNYTGFFFTPDDDPFAMWPDSAALFVETAEGWEYRERDHNPGGDNLFRSRKLAPYYYYFYTHF